MYFVFCLPPLIQLEWRLSACIPGPKTISPTLARWSIRSFSPEDLHLSSEPLLDWLKALGCSRIAIHFDVDVVDRNEIVFGLGAEADGLTSNEARRLVADVSAISDVVGLTIAEFIPRQVIRLQQVLRDFPLI